MSTDGNFADANNFITFQQAIWLFEILQQMDQVKKERFILPPPFHGLISRILYALPHVVFCESIY